MLSIKPQSVQAWESDDPSRHVNPRTNRLEEIARVLGVSKSWLLGEENDDSVHNLGPQTDIVKSIPLISWVRAGQWSEAIDMYEPGYAEEFIPVTGKVGPNTFGVPVKGDSMEPEFPEGMILIVDPSVEPAAGRYVVAKKNGHATFKQLVQDTGTLYLKPLNSRYPTIPVDESVEIVGVVISANRRL